MKMPFSVIIFRSGARFPCREGGSVQDLPIAGKGHHLAGNEFAAVLQRLLRRPLQADAPSPFQRTGQNAAGRPDRLPQESLYDFEVTETITPLSGPERGAESALIHIIA